MSLGCSSYHVVPAIPIETLVETRKLPVVFRRTMHGPEHLLQLVTRRLGDDIADIFS